MFACVFDLNVLYFDLQSASQYSITARIAAITSILIYTSIAWFILAATIDHRTYQSDDKLRPGVASIWGSPQEQDPPSASYVEVEVKLAERGGKIAKKRAIVAVARKLAVLLTGCG